MCAPILNGAGRGGTVNFNGVDLDDGTGRYSTMDFVFATGRDGKTKRDCIPGRDVFTTGRDRDYIVSRRDGAVK